VHGPLTFAGLRPVPSCIVLYVDTLWTPHIAESDEVGLSRSRVYRYRAAASQTREAVVCSVSLDLDERCVVVAHELGHTHAGHTPDILRNTARWDED
jgi:hypothetical protein